MAAAGQLYSIHGEMAVMYLFTRYRFNWDEVDFSVFSTYSMVTGLVGTIISVGLFSHTFKMDDAIIGVLSCLSKILSSFVYAFATTNWMIYLAPLVELLNGTSFIAMRSIATKLVPADELGKVNSLFGVCEALMPLAYGPMYSLVYASTMDTVPGTFFLLGGALTAPAVLIFMWMYTVHKKLEKNNQLDINGTKKGDGELTNIPLPQENGKTRQMNGFDKKCIPESDGVGEKSNIPELKECVTKHGIENESFVSDKDK